MRLQCTETVKNGTAISEVSISLWLKSLWFPIHQHSELNYYVQTVAETRPWWAAKPLWGRRICSCSCSWRESYANIGRLVGTKTRSRLTSEPEVFSGDPFHYPTGEQRWRSGESTRLPLVWPGFDSPIQRVMWAEFLGSLSCSKRVFLGYSGFPLSPKTNISPTRPHKLTALNCKPCINKVSLFFTIFYPNWIKSFETFIERKTKDPYERLY